jgi:hypothetical protein
MKRTTVLYSACLGALMSTGCSQGDAPRTFGSNAGTSSMVGTAGSAVGSAGTAGTASAAGGAPAAGGTAPVGMGGAGGSAVVPPTGGSGGSVVAAGGSASGGAPAAGGMTSTGAGGAAGGTSGGLSAADIVPDLEGYYWEGTCAGTIAVEGHNCPLSDNNSSCPSNGVTRDKTVMVKGVSGQVYTINFEVRGVIGTRCYTGGTRASSDPLSESGNNNWWYIGGTYANPTGWWNSYELHVKPSATTTASEDVYYFNGSGVQGGNDCEREATYLVKYTASFKAKGGSTLTFRLHDQNCKGQQNCGSNPDGNSACAPRTVDMTGMTAKLPTAITQPPANGNYKPQWMLIGVTSITSP